MTSLILASTSPRRSAILQQVGIPFRVIPSEFTEQSITGKTTLDEAKKLAVTNAKGKAVSVAKKEKGLILGVDTIVFFDNEVLGKPKDVDDAHAMLCRLNGETHQILSGFCLLDTDGNEIKEITGCDSAFVHMRQNAPETIERYVASGEPMDKAGAYGIQEKGAVLVAKVEGDFYTVVGLPLSLLLDKTSELGYPLV